MWTIAILIEDDFEDAVLPQLRTALGRQGNMVAILGLQVGDKHLGLNGTEPIFVEHALTERSPEDFDALLIPDGDAARRLSERPVAVSFVRRAVQAGLPVAALGRGVLLLVEADVVRDRKMTSDPLIQDDVVEAGARWIDATLVTDGNLLTTGGAPDLDDFMAALTSLLDERASDGDEQTGGFRHADYGRQTHGGQQYGTEGEHGQKPARPRRSPPQPPG